MPYFYILRVVREDNPLDRTECQVKFYPVLTHFSQPRQVEAEDELAASKLVAEHFPFHHFAVQEVTSYDRTVARLITKRLLRGNETPKPRAKTEGAERHRELNGTSRIHAASSSRPDENEKAAELAF